MKDQPKTISLRDIVLYAGLAAILVLAYFVLTDPNISNFKGI